MGKGPTSNKKGKKEVYWETRCFFFCILKVFTFKIYIIVTLSLFSYFLSLSLQIFSHIDKNKKGRVKVFFCGSPVLGKVLKNKCQQYGFQFAKENF